uniref:Endonuclease V n=1 Tax=Amphiprion percula TaxID=161767 RepID=A0A3P8T4Z4_AMPPE
SESEERAKPPQQVNSLFQPAAVCFGVLYILSDFDSCFFASSDRCSAKRRRQLPTHCRLGQSARKGAAKDTLLKTKWKQTLLTEALRSSDKSAKPVYVSVGHKISLDTAVRLTHSCCRYRVPEPIRQADCRSREYLRKHFPAADT